MNLKLDPIRYAWELCNPRAPLPAPLAKSAPASSVGYIQSHAPKPIVAATPAQAAFHAWVVRDV